ncbi:MAG: hypothetical protein ACK5MF_04825 [Vibrio sp.]|uniref:hypothetical protein n=1 Tax=Vibrio sp. TaxID=678 RepID=UPI003A85B882
MSITPSVIKINNETYISLEFLQEASVGLISSPHELMCASRDLATLLSYYQGEEHHKTSCIGLIGGLLGLAIELDEVLRLHSCK